MKSLSIATAAAAVMTAALVASPLRAADQAEYKVSFDATWTAGNHPVDYPGNAHLSGLIGATHNDSYSVFADGMTATPGLEALTERGAHAPLDAEIKSISAGKAGVLFESGPLFKFPGSIAATFMADGAHAYVSVAAMVAPSPDWFTGVSHVALMKGGRWIEKATFPLYAWDAGTDRGTTYAAADQDAMPRQSVRLNAAPHFRGAKSLNPVGTVTFTRINKTASN